MEPTGKLSLYDLLLKVAKAGGVAYYGSAGASKAMIPQDVHDLDKCLGIVNDGIRLFISSGPPQGWNWQKRLAEITFTDMQVDGTSDAASATTLDDSVLAATYDEDDDLVGYYAYITSGTGDGSYARITDYDYQTGSITAFADGTGGYVTVTSASHGLSDGETVTISGTTSYNGSFAVSSVATNTFKIVDTWVANDATGTWKYAQVTVADWLDQYGNPGGTDPVAGDEYSITLTKTVCGDKTRYFLPDDFHGDVSGQITYAQSTGHGHLIDWCGEGTIRQNQEITLTTGYPMNAAVRPSPVRRKWELVVDPSPTAADTVVFPYRVGFNRFQALTGTATADCSATALVDSGLITQSYPDNYFIGWTAEIVSGTGVGSYAVITDYTQSTGTFTVTKWLAVDGTSTGTAPATSSVYYLYDGYTHPAGMMFDECVLSACLCKAESEFEDLQLGYTEKFYKVDLPLAYQLDARSAPKKLGVMQSATGARRNRFYWDTVSYPGNEE